MSDCSTNANRPYDVARLRIEFGDGEVPWMYPLALNGRVIRGVYVDGERYTHERTCRDASLDSSTQFYCSECECTVDVPLAWGAVNYCPGCGARVKEGGDD